MMGRAAKSQREHILNIEAMKRRENVQTPMKMVDDEDCSRQGQELRSAGFQLEM
jgi:hypothetical protein